MAFVKLGEKALTSTVKLKENGKMVEFYVSKHDYESELNGPGRTLLVRKDCYDRRQWNTSSKDTYANSDIDAWYNGDYKNLLAADIQAAMGTTKFYYTPGGGKYIVTILARSVFSMSGTELGISNFAINVEGAKLPDEVVELLKTAYFNGAKVSQWLRTVRTDWPQDGGSGMACHCTSGSLTSGSGGSKIHQVYGYSRPAFTLPSSLLVGDDGTITTNTAPTTPSKITIPAQINGGSTVTVEWGTATDAEGNLEGYKVERSTDGGTSWSQVFQGNSTSTTSLVPFGSESVMYRVKAYDSEGLESGWKTSAQVTVINNTAPTVPAGITVPEAVQGGQPLAISWGPSTDGENNLAGYSLERRVDGGEWETVFSGNELAFTDQITKGWQTVAYRVRAFDTASAYSGFAVSETRTVNNNTPPAITCEHPANTPLGVKSEGFAFSYSVEDEEGDEVAVTEAVDGSALRTFTAELGAQNSFALDGADFMKLLNGRHTLAITAADSASSAVHSLSFTKEVTSASVTLERPMEADGLISVCVLSVSGFIPLDAEYRVEATNNALDDAPAWEDCTAAVRAGANYVFENQDAANGFAFNFRLHVERGSSGIGGYITSVQGGFQ